MYSPIIDVVLQGWARLLDNLRLVTPKSRRMFTKGIIAVAIPSFVVSPFLSTYIESQFGQAAAMQWAAALILVGVGLFGVCVGISRRLKVSKKAAD